MRRSVFLLVLLTAATAFAIDTHSHPIRVDILGGDPRMDRHDTRASDLVRNTIQRELRRRGYDAGMVDASMEDVERGLEHRADYYVEVTGWADHSGAIGGVTVPVSPNVAASVDLVMSRVAANLRLYDGRSLAVVHTSDLSRNRTAIAPGVGFGGRALWAFVGLPIVKWADYRQAADSIGRQAAAEIDEALRH